MRKWSTLKKLIWLYGSGAVGGAKFIWQIVTGAAPLSLVGAVAHSIKSLTQYGLCVQDGTPTPDAPVDIVTNNGALKVRRQSGLPVWFQQVEWLKADKMTTITGLKTKDSFDIFVKAYRSQAVAQFIYQADNGSSLTTNTSAYTSAGGNANWRFGKATIQGAFPVGEMVETRQNRNGVWWNDELIGAYSNVGTFESVNDFAIAGATSGGADPSLQIYYVYAYDGDDLVLDAIPVRDLTDDSLGWYDKVSEAFYTNAEATYTAGADVSDPIEVYADGTPEVLTISGKNLFDKAAQSTSYYYNNAGEEAQLSAGSSKFVHSAKIPCKPNTAYTLSGTSVFPISGSTTSYYYKVTFWDAEGNFISYNNGNSVYNGAFVRTITTPANCAYIAFNSFTTDTDVQLEEGSTGTDYEPYVTPQTVNDVPMLLSVGDYADEGEIISGIKTGKVGIKVFDGTETFTVSSSGAMITVISDAAVGAENTPMNTHFALETSATSVAVGTQRFGASGTKIYSTNYYMKHASITAVADFKSWLASEYAAGTPVIVLYPLAAETTEQTTPHALHTTRGTNVVDVAAAVEGVTVAVEYAKEATS